MALALLSDSFDNLRLIVALEAGSGTPCDGARLGSPGRVRTMIQVLPRAVPERGCPYLGRQADVREQVIPGFCQDPLSGVRKSPGFWEYWNRCTMAKHIVCLRYRRFRQSEIAIQCAAPSSLRRSA